MGEADEFSFEDGGIVGEAEAVVVGGFFEGVEAHFVAVSVPHAAFDMDVFIPSRCRKVFIFNQRATRVRGGAEDDAWRGNESRMGTDDERAADEIRARFGDEDQAALVKLRLDDGCVVVECIGGHGEKKRIGL